MTQFVTVASLVIAVLAVFVGPALSFVVTRRQIASGIAVANRQVLAPLREKWMCDFRSTVADLLSFALHYYEEGLEARPDSDQRHLFFLQHKVALMLDPTHPEHERLGKLISHMVRALETSEGHSLEFERLHADALALSRSILRSEWERVKEPVAPV